MQSAQSSSTFKSEAAAPVSTHDSSQPRRNKAHLNAILITFTVVVLAVFFGIQLINRTGVFHQAGKLVFDTNLTEENRDFLNNNLTNLPELAADVQISSHEATTYPTKNTTCTDSSETSPEDECLIEIPIVYNILLPTTEWGSSLSDISATEASQYQLISVWDLNKDEKLLSIDGNYYLDSFESGAFFEYFNILGQSDDVNKIVELLQAKIAALPTKDTVLTLAQTGVTALSRRMNTKLDQIGTASYFAEYIGDFLSSFDFTHTSNEASFSSLADGSNICAKPGMIDAITASGIDIIELTGNHNQDCGDQDAIDTIAKYQELGIQTFGGGVSATAAAAPLELASKDNHITMLGYNLSTGGYTLDETPGANFYTAEKAQADIAAAKARGDTIIVDIQYYECNEYADTAENTTCDYADSAAGDQVGFFRSLIDMGADVVIGTAAHQPQTYEQYHGGEIYYGLGNLYFDQSAWPGTTRSLVLVHYFWQNQLIQTRIVPTVYDHNFQTKLMDTVSAAEFLQRLIQARPAQ